MGRPQKLDELWASGLTRAAAKNATYNEAGQMTKLHILNWSHESSTNDSYYITETRQYNYRHQLTRNSQQQEHSRLTLSATDAIAGVSGRLSCLKFNGYI